MRLLGNTGTKQVFGASTMNDANTPDRAKPSPAKLPPEASSEQRQAVYEAYVAEMARKADGTLFLNHDQIHAEIVLAQLFRTAVSEVKILSGCLLEQVYGSERVTSAAAEFANRSPHAKLTILHEHPVGQNRFVESMTGLMGDRFSLTKVEPCSIGHFAVADAKHFRFETDQDHHKAFVAFGDDRLGSALSEMFDEIAA